jgi:DNA-binding IclR family transcriptional regulator
VVKVSGQPLADLRDRINQSCSLSVWGNKGPTVVRIEVAVGTIIVTTRIGTVGPLLTTASGLVFATFQQDEQVRRMLESEEEELARSGRQDLIEGAKHIIAEARKYGLAAATNTLTPGVSGISAPIFDHQRKLAAAMTVFGPTGIIDESLSGTVAQELLAAASATGRLLGCPPEDQTDRKRRGKASKPASVA